MTQKERDALFIEMQLNLRHLVKQDADKETRIRFLEKTVWATLGSSFLVLVGAIVTAYLN